MKYGVLVLLAVLVVAVLGLWLFAPKGAATMTDTASSTATQTTAGTLNGSSAGTSGGGSSGGTTAGNGNTFKSIFTQEGNHECLYSGFNGTTKMDDVVQISDGKMHGEFRTTEKDGSSTNTIMVYNLGTLYTWVEGKTTGSKSSLTSLADLPQAIPSDITSAAIFGTTYNNVSWDCHAWIPDASKLKAPTYVTFSAR